MVEMGKLAGDAPEAERRVRAALTSGDALDRFRLRVLADLHQFVIVDERFRRVFHPGPRNRITDLPIRRPPGCYPK